MIKTTCDIPLVKLANKNLKPQKYLKKADSAPNLSKIEDGGVEVKVETPIFYARILLIFVPSTFVESLKKNMCQFPKVAIPLKSECHDTCDILLVGLVSKYYYSYNL